MPVPKSVKNIALLEEEISQLKTKKHIKEKVASPNVKNEDLEDEIKVLKKQVDVGQKQSLKIKAIQNNDEICKLFTGIS